MKWHEMVTMRSKKPQKYRYVLLQVEKKEEDSTPIIAVGYIKNFIRDDGSLFWFFVIPGVGGKVNYWSDCLGDDFIVFPAWKGEQVS